MQCGVPGPAGPRGPRAQPPAVVAIIKALGPAPVPRPPQARTSVWGCTRRRHCVPRRPAQVLSTSGWGWEHHGALLAPPEGPGVVNLVPTHNPQKAGHCGLSGVHAPKMESKPAAGAVRSWPQSPVPVLETAARAAPAPTARFRVGPQASTFTPALPTDPPVPCLSEACICGTQDETPGRGGTHTLGLCQASSKKWANPP